MQVQVEKRIYDLLFKPLIKTGLIVRWSATKGRWWWEETRWTLRGRRRMEACSWRRPKTSPGARKTPLLILWSWCLILWLRSPDLWSWFLTPNPGVDGIRDFNPDPLFSSEPYSWTWILKLFPIVNLYLWSPDPGARRTSLASAGASCSWSLSSSPPLRCSLVSSSLSSMSSSSSSARTLDGITLSTVLGQS